MALVVTVPRELPHPAVAKVQSAGVARDHFGAVELAARQVHVAPSSQVVVAPTEEHRVAEGHLPDVEHGAMLVVRVGFHMVPTVLVHAPP